MMVDVAEAIAANAAFYDAFRRGDRDAVYALLAQHEGQAVLHPGWAPLRGRAAVHQSWLDVAANPPPVELLDPVGAWIGPGIVLITCVEVVGATVLAASNLWIREDGRWRLLLHHAGESPGAEQMLERLRDADVLH